MHQDERDMVQIANIIGNFGIFADKHQWEELQSLMAPVVLVDYTSLFGGVAQEQKREDLITGWSQFLPRFAGTEHHIGQTSITITNDQAVVRAAITAYHFTGEPLKQLGDTWVIGGHYRFSLKKMGADWKIAAITLEALWQKGNPPI